MTLSNTPMLNKTKSTIGRINSVADAYDNRWANYLENTHRKVLDIVDPQAGDIILDVSAGTGLLAQRYIERGFSFQELVLNDPSDNMLLKARQRLNDYPNVRFTEQPAELLNFQPNTFDKIFCTSAFHNYPTQETIVGQLKKLLKPGGTIFMLDWNNSGWFRPVNWYITWKVPEEHINTRSYSEMKTLLQDAGFTLLHSEEWYFSYWKFYLFKAQRPT